jgi:hypothetical protein
MTASTSGMAESCVGVDTRLAPGSWHRTSTAALFLSQRNTVYPDFKRFFAMLDPMAPTPKNSKDIPFEAAISRNNARIIYFALIRWTKTKTKKQKTKNNDKRYADLAYNCISETPPTRTP